jgi:hypothetical protein
VKKTISYIVLAMILAIPSIQSHSQAKSRTTALQSGMQDGPRTPPCNPNLGPCPPDGL